MTNNTNYSNNTTSNKKESHDSPSPPDFGQLGRSTWLFLHTMAAAYPWHPSNQQQQDMRQFMHLFSQFYPCHYCAEDFQDIIQQMPPRTENKRDFSYWMCEAHNEVNSRIGNTPVDCDKAVSWYLRGASENDDEDCEFCEDVLGKDKARQLNQLFKGMK
eukprot:gb/GECH01011059.1/.p1 GENE.gb/GECH01011059.1/~~gb/GECH01011059.1/.p1  ORF type:complete len:159 (+),score=32.12 gb/GECH01011059.1/:1-477(+)